MPLLSIVTPPGHWDFGKLYRANITNQCCPWEICYRSLDGSLIGYLCLSTVWELLWKKNHRKKKNAEHHSLLSKTLFTNPLGCQNSIQMLLQPFQIFIHVSMQRNSSWIHSSNYKAHLQQSLSVWKFFSYSVFVCILETAFGKINTIRDQINTPWKCTAFHLFDGMYCQGSACGIHTLMPNLELHILVLIFMSFVLDQESPSRRCFDLHKSLFPRRLVVVASPSAHH